MSRGRRVPIEVDIGGSQRRVAEDEIGRLLRDHHDGRENVGVGDVGEDRRVDDAQTLESVHAHVRRIDDRMSSVPILAVHEGCSAVSASRATQSRISSSVVTLGPGESSPPLKGAKAPLTKDVASDADGLHPLALVLLGGEVVKTNGRMNCRIS